MFYRDGGKLQCEVKVDKPNPVFSKALTQVIGRVLGCLIGELSLRLSERADSVSALDVSQLAIALARHVNRLSAALIPREQ